MGSAHGVQDAPREQALRDDPASVIALADIDAWERAEGLTSDAAAEAVRRKDVERWIPGLSARRTFMTLGWIVLGAVFIDSVLSLFPDSDWVDDLDMVVRFGTAWIGVIAAAWSILSEIRGWEGSDAATWFLKARIKRYEKKLEARRRESREIPTSEMSTSDALFDDAPK